MFVRRKASLKSSIVQGNAKSPAAKRGFTQASQNATARRRSQCSQETQGSQESADGAPQPKIKRLSSSDVALFLLNHNIKTKTELMAIAKQRHQEGLSDLFNFIVTKSPKALCDIITNVWDMQAAPRVIERSNMNRMDVVMKFMEEPCVEGCDSEWLTAARSVLRNNEINVFVFADAVRECLRLGRKKKNNIMLVGPTNCGKYFLLNPIELMYNCFVNPASGKYAWVGLDEKEVAYLNDLRWTEELIRWSDFLLLLEGQTVHLPRPNNQFAIDLVITRENTLPFLSTSKAPIEFIGRYNCRDKRESEMMNSRWKVFSFKKQIENPRDPHCFAKLVVQGMHG